MQDILGQSFIRNPRDARAWRFDASHPQLTGVGVQADDISPGGGVVTFRGQYAGADTPSPLLTGFDAALTPTPPRGPRPSSQSAARSEAASRGREARVRQGLDTPSREQAEFQARLEQARHTLGYVPPVQRVQNVYVDHTFHDDDTATFMQQMFQPAGQPMDIPGTPIDVSALVPTARTGGPVLPTGPTIHGTPAPAVAAPPGGYRGELDQSYVPSGRNLPSIIPDPYGQLRGDANSTYLMTGAGGPASQMGNNDIFAARAKRREFKRHFTQDFWWLKDPLKLNHHLDKQMANAARNALMENPEHVKRQRLNAERELSRFPRFRLYASMDHGSEEVLSHKLI